jgi:hypothetical protein
MDGDDYDLYLDSYVEAPEAVPLEVTIVFPAIEHKCDLNIIRLHEIKSNSAHPGGVPGPSF